MEFLDKRILGVCNELKKLAVRQRVAINNWQYKRGNFVYPSQARTGGGPFTPFDCRTMRWYGPDEHYWFGAEY